MGCSQDKSHSTQKYKQIDYLNLIGLERFQDNETIYYPAFELSGDSIKRTLKVFYSQRDVFTYSFERVNGKWTYCKQEEEEDEYVKYECVILDSDRKVTFHYRTQNGQNFLTHLDLSEHDRSTSYIYDLTCKIGEISVNKYPSVDQIITNYKPLRTQHVKYIMKNDTTLQVTMSIVDQNETNIFYDVRCHDLKDKDINSYSESWMSFFSVLDQVKCQ